MRAPTLDARTLVLAVAGVQLAAFAVASALGRPTLYVVFAVASAGVLGASAGRGAFGVVAALCGGTLLVALAYPLATLATFTTPGAVLDALARPDVRRTLYVSVYAPLLATLLAAVLGVPLALLLRRGFTGRPVVEALVDLPLVVPHSVAGLAVLLAFGESGAFPTLPVLGAMPGLVLALAFVAAPYLVNGAREGFEAVDRDAERAARSLGASRFETFRRVTGPLAVRGVLSGAVLSWGRAVSEYGAVAVVAYNVTVFYPPAGERVQAMFGSVFVVHELDVNFESAVSVAVLLLVVCVAVFLAVRALTRETGRWT
ncbi:ABC transporter permease [Halarchaeum sp. CBA1220]|uniref:ABC transporter permease n=1 Tax=Halarchaeum sp. CBA1220 TaxID=1853682 RepID=UPI000F3A9699|nr:ABC transporter permease [Halarchaeum sp. CBA1220]QLC33149.1 ABC transporter permease [Halarchaeum sp. CBA1220]